MDFPGKGNRKMKKLLFAVSALAALSLLTPSTGFAQHESSSNNQLGLFLNPNGTGGTTTAQIGVAVPVYLVLINATDELDGEAEYNVINAFECMLNFTGGALFKLADVLPTPSVNVGDNTDINQGYLEYIVGMGAPMPFNNRSALLCSFQFMASTPALTEISLTMTTAPSIPGVMAYESVSGQLRQMYNASGTEGGLNFTFNQLVGPVAIEKESFGSVKALFR
jgi:hypothetical protein